MKGIIGFSDNFLKIKKDALYEPRGAAFLMKNTGNTDILLNDIWLLKPCETYGLLNQLPHAVNNGLYRVKMGVVNVLNDEPVKAELVIAEVHYTDIDLAEYAK